jgi:cell division protein FtsB
MASVKDQRREASGRTDAANRGRRRLLRFRLGYIPILIVLGLFSYAFLQKTQEVRRLSAEEAALLAQNRQIQLDNQRTERQNRYYRTQAYEIEAARSQLGYDLPGDTAVEVNTVKPPVVAVRKAAPAPQAPPPPVWRQWWKDFFG